MPDSTLLVARRILLALAFATPFAAVHAQTAPAAAPGTAATATPAAPPGQDDTSAAASRRNQKVENIHTEDTGASVDEVRYGGRTQSINVKPKSGAPGYEVLPSDANASKAGAPETGANGPRVWNVMKF